MKISEEYKKDELEEFMAAASWMTQGAGMILDLVEKEERREEVSRSEIIDAKAMLNKGVIAMEEFNKAKKEQKEAGMNRQQRRFNKKNGKR